MKHEENDGGVGLDSMKYQTGGTPRFGTKLCTLPSPIDTFKIYGFLAIASFCWILWSRSCQPTPGAGIEYVELEDVAAKDEETQTTNRVNGHGRTRRGLYLGWRRGYILAILGDCVSLCLFVGMGFFLQILGIL